MWGRGSVSSATRCLNVRRWCGQRTRLGLGCHGSSIRPSRSVVPHRRVRGAVVVGHPLEAERRGRELETGPEIGLAEQTGRSFSDAGCAAVLCTLIIHSRRQQQVLKLRRRAQRSKQSSGCCCLCVLCCLQSPDRVPSILRLLALLTRLAACSSRLGMDACFSSRTWFSVSHEHERAVPFRVRTKVCSAVVCAVAGGRRPLDDWFRVAVPRPNRKSEMV